MGGYLERTLAVNVSAERYAPLYGVTGVGNRPALNPRAS